MNFDYLIISICCGPETEIRVYCRYALEMLELAVGCHIPIFKRKRDFRGGSTHKKMLRLLKAKKLE